MEKHHSGRRDRKDNLNRLKELYDIMKAQSLSLLLSVGTVIRNDLYNRTSNIDLCFGIPGVEAQLIRCLTHQREERDMNKESNHFSIEMILDLR